MMTASSDTFSNTFSYTLGLVLCLGTLMGMAGCTSATKVTSRPSQAEVVLAGETRLGQTPLELRDMAWVWRTRKLQVRKDGYYTGFVDLESSYRGSSVALCMCSLGFLWPVLFVGEYPGEIVVELDPIERAERIDFGGASAVQFP